MNKYAVIFPGQGSQSVGMLSELALSHPLVLKTFETASSVLGYDLWDLVSNGPEDKLNQTTYTQPALLTASVAIWNVFEQNNPKILPSYLAGHSLGEYSALVASQSLDFKDAVKLVAARGQFMQDAVPNDMGAMAAVLGIDDNAIIQDLIAEFDTVEIANLNAVGQTVIAGKKTSVLLAVEKLKNNGAKLAKVLDVSVPSHCSLMQPAAQKLKQLLGSTSFNTPVVPVIHNYSVASYNTAEEMRSALVEQLISPVRWVETINTLHNHGVSNIYEFGPGSVLAKLCKRINSNVNCVAVNTAQNLTEIN